MLYDPFVRCGFPVKIRPITEFCSGEQPHQFVRGLAPARFDAILRQNGEARRFLAFDVAAGLAARGVNATARH
jgi:hypothetical protein